MSSNSSGYRVRRQLSFQDVPYRGKLFYVDIKLQSLKQKIVQRILDLGGQIESFLSKELDVILIDGDENKKTTTNFNKLQNIPLSRGQALLNASTDNKGDGSTKKNDIIHRASLLGVKTQTAKEFLQVTAKAISKIKLQKKAQQKENDFLQGMSPITWDKDKENCYFLKVEDNAQCYRPLFKQLETAPKIAYNETGSPFDVGIVLTRHNDGNQSKKKIIKAPPKGGYCESCDHWYKGILKEHLKSTKHLAFISSTANFKSLEIISAGLPGLGNFLRKFDPDSDNKKVGECEGTKMMGEPRHIESHCKDDNSASNQDIINSVDSFSYFINKNDAESKVKTGSNKDSSTSDASSIPLPTLIDKESVQSSTFTKGIASNSLLQGNLSGRYIGSEGLKIASSETNLTTTVMNQCNASELIQDSDTFKNRTNRTIPINQTAQLHVSDKLPTCQLTFNNFIPEANFSSSSCSFGDHGVANVLTFLQSHDSEGRSTKQQSGRQSAETVLTEKSQNSRESCIVKGSSTSFESVSSKEIWGAPLPMEQFVKASSEQDFSNMMAVSCENQSANGMYSETKSSLEHNQELPYSNCDTFKLEQKLHTKTSLVTTNPDYSNITEESISSEIPKVVNFKSIQGDQVSKVDTSQTPSKAENETLRDEMMKNVANSGGTWSSIRNWLLPGDEVDHANQPNEDLDKTLVMDDSQKVPQAVNLTVKNKCDISNIFNENSAESSNNFVAAWIKNQKFEVSGEFVTEAQPADSNNNINDVLKTSAIEDKESIHVNEAGKMFDVIKSIQKDNETTLNNDVKSEVTQSNYLSDDLSDCTSISDCTLENFRINPLETLDNIEAAKKEEKDDKFDKQTKDSECLSQKSSISCHLTDKGIKIKGLFSFKQTDDKSSVPNKKAQQPCVGNGDKTDLCIPIGETSLSRNDAPMKNSSFQICDLPVTSKQAPEVSSGNAHSSQKCATPSLQSLDNDVQCKDIGQNAIKDLTISQALLPSKECKTVNNFQCQTLKKMETLQCSNPTFPDTLDYSSHSSQPLQVSHVEKHESCIQNTFNQEQPMVSSPMMNDCRFSAKRNIPNYSEKQYIGANMPGSMQHTVNQANFPGSVQHTVNQANFPGSMQHTVNQANIPGSMQHTVNQANIPGNVQHTVNQANIPGSVQHTVNQANIPGNVQHTVNQANFPGSLQHTVNQANIPGNVQHTVNQANFPGSLQHTVNQANNPERMQHTVNQANIPGRMQHTVNQANIPGRMQHTVNQANIPGRMQHTVNQANIPGSVQHTVNQSSIQWDYFNTGILPYETQCAKSYSNNMGSFPSEVLQSFASSSYYLSSMTDYLAVSSPRHDSSSSQQYMCVNQGSAQGTFLNSNIHGPCLQNIQYPPHTLSGSLPDTTMASPACNSKPTAAKKNGRKTEKRKRNDSQPSFLSSTSSFCANNSNQLSHCGFSSGMVEPTLSLQSDWYPSSPQSAVSSACLSTIRTEDIAEGNCQYSYYKAAVPKKRKLTEANVAYQHHRDSAIVNSSTPNSQGYYSPHSAMYEGNNSSMVYPHLTNGAPCSSPFNQVPQSVSQIFPSHLPQQTSQYIAGISQPTINGANNVTNNSFSYHKSTPNDFPMCSPVLTKQMFQEVNSNFDNRNFVQSNVQDDKTKQATSRCVYNAEQTGETRLKLRKVPVSRPEQQNDLKNYWNVRKAGDCRLVFSSQIGKRKASEETPYIVKDADFVGNGNNDDYNQAKKRRCLVY